MTYARIKTQNWEECFWVDHDLIEGKLYPVSWLAPDNLAFGIVDEVGYELYCLVEGCGHLGGGDWELIEAE